MPRYRYLSEWPEVFADLENGVNATVFRDGADPEPDGSTVLLVPGDEIEIDEPYEHAHLAEIDPVTPAPTPVPDGTAPAPAEEPTA